MSAFEWSTGARWWQFQNGVIALTNDLDAAWEEHLRREQALLSKPLSSFDSTLRASTALNRVIDAITPKQWRAIKDGKPLHRLQMTARQRADIDLYVYTERMTLSNEVFTRPTLPARYGQVRLAIDGDTRRISGTYAISAEYYPDGIVRPEKQIVEWKIAATVPVVETPDGGIKRGYDPVLIPKIPPLVIDRQPLKNQPVLRSLMNPGVGVTQWLELFTIVRSATGFSVSASGDFLKKPPNFPAAPAPVARVLAEIEGMEKRSWVLVNGILTLSMRTA